MTDGAQIVTTEQLGVIHEFLEEQSGQVVDPADVRGALEAAGMVWLPEVGQPADALAVVRDLRGRRYFRWSCDAHTSQPWRLLGAVHGDTDENYRWTDLAGDRRPVEIESRGVLW